VLLVSLVGHYEKTALHLAGAEGLGSYASVDGPVLVRVRARNVASLLRAAVLMLRHCWLRNAPMIGVPRSNSRALRMLVALARRVPLFSYSDGLGDTAHRFVLGEDTRYVGHVGFSLLSPPPLIHTIPLTESREPWGDCIRHDPAAPVLVIVKRPKEVDLQANHLARLYDRIIKTLRLRHDVVLSGIVDGLSAGEGLRQVGPLSRLTSPLAISGAVGLPSTAFLTLATCVPLQQLHVIKLGCRRSSPEAVRRNRLMLEGLARCLPTLAQGTARPNGVQRW
jgi:hypothetical protein